jgi:UDP-N-acetylglucosamine--dolichyl-phosphate N-acetylglucosaminephosphotransferase
MSLPILVSIGISILAYISTKQLIPGLKNMFLAANLAGIDMNKKTKSKMQVFVATAPKFNFHLTLSIL